MKKPQEPLVEQTLQLGPEASGSTRLVPFRIPSETSHLRCEFQISAPEPATLKAQKPAARQALDRYYLEGEPAPAYLEADEPTKQKQVERHASELQNAVSFALYDASGTQLGRRDAYSPQDLSAPILIGARDSSPGFRNVPLPPGRYTLALEILQILAQSTNVRITISTEEFTAESTTCSIATDDTAAEKASVPHDAENSVPSQEPEEHWLKALVLVPTEHGEGENSIDRLRELAEARGLDAIVVADTNSSVAWSAPFPETSCMFLTGQVFDTYSGRCAGLNLVDPITINDSVDPTPLPWIISRVQEQSGAFAVLHPYALGAPVRPGYRWLHKEVDLGEVDLLHVWPGPWETQSPEIVNALRLWDYMLVNGLKTHGFGADLQSLSRSVWPKRLPYLYLRCRGRSQTEIGKALTSGNFFTTVGPTIGIGLATGSLLARDGEEATLDEGTSYQVVVDVAGYEGSAMLRIVRDGVPYVEMPLSSKGTDRKVFHAMVDRPRTYFRAEIRQFGRSGDELLALTNPVVLNARPFWWERPESPPTSPS